MHLSSFARPAHIGVVCFTYAAFSIVFFLSTGKYDEAVGWGIFAVVYAIPYSIVGLIYAVKPSKTKIILKQLAELSAMREEGALSDDEFRRRISDYLKNRKIM